MISKKTKKDDKVKTPKKTAKTKKAQAKPQKKSKEVPSEDAGLIVIDDDISVDKNQELEERRAYLEEARSQETSD